MKFNRITLLSSNLLLLIALCWASEKQVEKSHFLNVNPNIKNEKLKGELEVLKLDFDNERQKIEDYYKREIERLREERRSEFKALKKDFWEMRETLFRKHGEDRKKKHSKSDRSNLKETNIKKDKKPIRKPK